MSATTCPVAATQSTKNSVRIILPFINVKKLTKQHANASANVAAISCCWNLQSVTLLVVKYLINLKKNCLQCNVTTTT